MNENKFISLVYKRLKAEISEDELIELEVLTASNVDFAQMADEIEQAWERSAAYPKPFEFDLDAEFSKLEERIEKADTPEAIQRTLRSNDKQQLNWLTIAAAIGLFIVAGALIWDSFFRAPDFIVVASQRGEVKQITLLDGSKVWLNENSQLQYPKSFNEENRTLKLIGEAFFEVQRSENHPFIVETNQTLVEVLGTSFNVRAIPNENMTSVIVRTGKVRFQQRYADAYEDLEVGQKSVFYHSSKQLAGAETIPNNNELYWKTKELSFHNMSLAEVAETLKSYFNVKLSFDNPEIKNCTYRRTLPFVNPEPKDIIRQIEGVFKGKAQKISSNSFLLMGASCDGI